MTSITHWGDNFFLMGPTWSTKHFSWATTNRGRRPTLFNNDNSYLRRENPWATLTKLRAFFGSTGNHSLEFHARHAGKMVISFFGRREGSQDRAIPFNIHIPPVDELSQNLLPKKKKIKVPTQHPPQKLTDFSFPPQKKTNFSSNPSEKAAKIKGSGRINPSETTFLAPSEKLVNRGGV